MYINWRQTGWLLIAFLAFFTVLFLNFPKIDLWFSSFFFSGTFAQRGNPTFEFIRYIFIDGLTILAILCVVLLVRSWMIGQRRAVPIQVWAYIVATFITGPLVMANGLFKSYWGRARPAEVEYFGGNADFSPPILISDQCDTNCSFVSGEGSAIATFIIVFTVVIWPNMTSRWKAATLYVGLPMSRSGIALRIITGRHFLSDTIFAVLFCGAIAWAFFHIFDMQLYRKSLTWANFKKDLSKAKPGDNISVPGAGE